MEKTKIEVVCGFLESGKTTLLQRILASEEMEQYEKIVVIQCEEGLTELRANPLRNKNVVQADVAYGYQISARLFGKIRRELNPDLILIEYNGTWPISDLLRVRLPSGYRIDRILFCADASTFALYLNNTGEMMAEQLSNADAVLFNRCSGESENLKITVKNQNRGAKLLFDEDAADSYLSAALEKGAVEERRTRRWGFGGTALLALIFIFLLTPKMPGGAAAYSFLKSVNTVFIGVLLQAVPFLLIGVFVSSMLQVLVSDDRLARIFTRHPLLGYPLAVAAGVLFPVCDCAMAPITSRLVRKGVPLPQAVTFMLASPAVNPVTFLSTLYAFPDHREYAVYRLLFGVAISLIVGLIVSVRKIDVQKVLIGGSGAAVSSGGYAGPLNYTGKIGRLEAVFRHAGIELLNVGRFIVCGALVSAILQIALPASVFQGTGKSVILPLIIMLLASFVMSVCSNSNAFIGRSFLNLFPLTAIIGFMVMGPMLDLSNLFMLSSSFHRKFILELTGTLFTVGFFVFLLCSFLIRS